MRVSAVGCRRWATDKSKGTVLTTVSPSGGDVNQIGLRAGEIRCDPEVYDQLQRIWPNGVGVVELEVETRLQPYGQKTDTIIMSAKLAPAQATPAQVKAAS